MLEKIMLYIGFIQINVVFFVWLYRFRRYRLADYIKGLPAEKAKSEFCPAQLEWEVKLKGAASSEGLMIVRDGVGWKVKEDKKEYPVMPIMFVRKTPKPARKGKGKELEAWVRSHLERLAALRGYSYTRPDAKFLRSVGKYTDRQVADFVLYAAEKGVWFLECKETAKSVFDQYEYATDAQRAHIEKIQEWRKNSWGEHWHAGFLIHFTRYAAYRWITQTSGVITPDSGVAWDWQRFYE